jgi:phi13 family phage major tail protein
MAKIGLSNLIWANLTEADNGTPSYDGAKSLGKAVSANVSITNNSATLYADDVLAESDTSFQTGTITCGVDEDADATFAPLLGHSNTEGVVVKNATDTAPWVGVGRIITKMVSGVYYYKAEVLYKVKFSEPSQDDSTKGESIEFRTPEIEGTIATLANGKWCTSQTFTTKANALAFIQGIFANSVTYTYTEVTPLGTENPKEEGWYIKNGTDYILALDTTVVADREYYEVSVGEG